MRKETEQDEDPVVKCCLCIEKGKKIFYKVSTFDIDRKIRACAFKVCNEELIRKLSGGDLTAQNAEYHLHCLIKLYREA